MPNAGNSPSSLADLTERLKSKTEQERQTAERQIEAEFKSLSVNVNASMKNALSTIENAMLHETATVRESTASHIKMLNNGFIKHWLVCGLLSLGLTSGLALGGWGLAALAQRQVTNLRQEVSFLKREKVNLEDTLKQLESQTWGLRLLETTEGRFIILPPKINLKLGWSFGKQSAAKLE
jgi:hypothetical protein